MCIFLSIFGMHGIACVSFSHENQGNEFFINKCNEPTSDGTTMFDLTIDWLSQVSLQLITLMPYSKHECGTHRTQKKTNQCGCHQSSLPTPWGIWVPPSLSGFIVHPRSDPGITRPYTKTYSLGFTMHSNPESLGPKKIKSTSWLYCISRHSPTRITRPTEAQNIALPQPTIWFRGY